MKKVLAICLMMVLVVCACAVTVSAASDRFVTSPSGNTAPTVVSAECASEGCTAQLVITPYAEKNELPSSLLALIKKAYSSIADSDDLSKLNADLAAAAAELGIDGVDLKVSDLFDIHYEGCDNHEEHTEFDIVLKADTLHRFVGLLHMNKDGEWELVTDAQVTDNGEHLRFSVDSFSPFAIVVDTSAVGGDSPETGVTVDTIYVYAVVMGVAAAALVVIAFVSKKKKA